MYTYFHSYTKWFIQAHAYSMNIQKYVYLLLVAFLLLDECTERRWRKKAIKMKEVSLLSSWRLSCWLFIYITPIFTLKVSLVLSCAHFLEMLKCDDLMLFYLCWFKFWLGILRAIQEFLIRNNFVFFIKWAACNQMNAVDLWNYFWELDISGKFLKNSTFKWLK